MGPHQIHIGITKSLSIGSKLRPWAWPACLRIHWTCSVSASSWETMPVWADSQVKLWTFQLCWLKKNSCVIPNSLEDLGRFLYRSPPELCLLCAPDSSATLSAICTGTIRNFMGHLHRDPPNLISHPEPSRTWPFETSSGICIGTFRNFVCYVHRTAQQLCLLSAPEPSGTSWAICTGTLRTWSAIRNPPASHQPSTPEPSRTSSAFCRNLCAGTLRNLICNLHQNSPELHQLSAPKPSGTSSAICAETLRKLVCYLRRNPPELHQPAAPELSGTSSAICTGISNLHRKAPEPSGTFSGTWCCSCTGSHQSFSGLKTP